MKVLQLSVEHIDKLVNVVSQGDYDYFYHLAWVGSAGPLRSDINVQVNNALLTVNCLKTAKKIGCKRFIVAGTIMEFETHKAIYDDMILPAPSYIYGAGKSLTHMLLKPLAIETGIELIWCYITNAYGVGELSPRLINTTIRKALKGEELNFSTATQNYDFVYIDDVARAFRLIGINGKTNHSYIIGSSNAKPLKEFLMELIQIVNPKLKPNFGALGQSGINLDINLFSTDKTSIDTGFNAEITFREGIIKTMNWLMEVDKDVTTI